MQKRVGAYNMKYLVYASIYIPQIYEPGYFSSWPFSKVQFFKDHMVVKMIGKKYELKYKDIDFIEKKLNAVLFHHHNPNLNKYFYLTNGGITSYLYKQIKELIKKNKLKIKFKE